MKKLGLTTLLTLAAASAHAGTFFPLVNGGFETTTGTSTGTNNTSGLPSTTGVWGGDDANIVTGLTGGVTPFEGTSMLEFSSSTTTAAANPGTASDVFNLIELDPWLSAITAGGVTVDASVVFNRGTSEPENRGLIQIKFYEFTSPSSFASSGAPESQIGGANDNTTNPFSRITLDLDAGTWETASLTNVAVPTNAQLIAIRIAGVEDLSDSQHPEFTQLFADNVTFSLTTPNPVPNPGPTPNPEPTPNPDPVIPEPTRAALLLLGAFGIVARRRRK